MRWLSGINLLPATVNFSTATGGAAASAVRTAVTSGPAAVKILV